MGHFWPPDCQELYRVWAALLPLVFPPLCTYRTIHLLGRCPKSSPACNHSPPTANLRHMAASAHSQRAYAQTNPDSDYVPPTQSYRRPPPGIISVRAAFTTRSFDDNSLVVVYACHPNSQTLFDADLKPKPPIYQSRYQHGRQQLLLQAQSTVIAKRTIWSYIVQIACTVKKVLGQAVRMIDVSKILLTGQNRIRISSCGIVDVLMHDAVQQQEDLTMFGRLVFALCCNNVSAATSARF
ncbi:uncharacterized protein LACBIDRAFT_297339 [Laccaria bicolor S238N-H82]|uniref:Predicted protein n=1 Tax=Laccaria bicolor (strain S238N-H82 / ATCC MYA-4686) TaxID=486041 RepID=B0DAJ3_LACBS|nr:uncharacterized protein LACBIDRAFT_297339 [Laccaria bicolor S238N-H82]EDR08760.1 predicted protein [Laccaria bicolor S238N-H82]|eukprot:XP_001880985.1 predicted protein [Laccaria bicolor S238N-H82]